MKITSFIFVIALLACRLNAKVAVQGTASWYGNELRGRIMANGQPFDPSQMTCASWFYPLGTKLRVSHKNRSVIVIVTDRGPAWRLVRQGRVIDLSRASFRLMSDLRVGLIDVTIQRL